MITQLKLKIVKQEYINRTVNTSDYKSCADIIRYRFVLNVCKINIECKSAGARVSGSCVQWTRPFHLTRSVFEITIFYTFGNSSRIFYIVTQFFYKTDF